MKKQRTKTVKYRGRIWKVYFESLYEYAATGDQIPLIRKKGKPRVTSCVVIANTTEEAIAKTHAAFPNERINTVFGEDRYGPSPREGRPLGDWIVI